MQPDIAELHESVKISASGAFPTIAAMGPVYRDPSVRAAVGLELNLGDVKGSADQGGGLGFAGCVVSD
jgi:hypothetical protein